MTSKLHIIKFGFNEIQNHNNIKYTNVLLQDLDFKKVKNVEIKVKTYFSNDWLDEINIKAKVLKYFFNKNNINYITINPCKNNNQYFELNINNICINTYKFIRNCELHITLKKGVKQEEFNKYVKFYVNELKTSNIENTLGYYVNTEHYFDN